MAQKTQIILVDDLDGGTAEETVSFSLDGVSYEIDLNSGNAARMRDVLAAYVGPARRVGGRSAGRRRGRGAIGDGRTRDIREWARTHGHPVNDRGRIAADVRAAYDRAHA